MAYSRVRNDYKEECTLESKSCLESVAAPTPVPAVKGDSDVKIDVIVWFEKWHLDRQTSVNGRSIPRDTVSIDCGKGK